MALLQLTQLTVGQPTSAPTVELDHLAVGTPDEGGQVSASRGMSPTPPNPTRAAPNRRPAGAWSPCCVGELVPRRGVVEHLQRVRETDAAGVGVVGNERRRVVLAGYPRRRAPRAFCHSSMMTARRAMACS